MLFKDRKEAGEKLAEKLIKFKGSENLLILGIPRGGVVVAREVADFLDARLDILVTRKIGHPYNSEFAVAAVNEDGEITKGDSALEVDTEFLETEAENQKNEIKRRLKEYRGIERHPKFGNKICILVDDGIATGLTIRSAIDFIKNHNPEKIVLALPVIPLEKLEIFSSLADEVIFVDAPEIFFSVSQFYEDFPQATDEEVGELLKRK